MLAALLCLALAPFAQQDWRSEVESLLAQDAVEAAIQRLEARLAEQPADVEAERALAGALERLVDGGASRLALEDARNAWDRALALAPADEPTQRGAIAVRLRLGDPDGALALAERALGAAWLEHGAASAPLLELACRARIDCLRAKEATLDASARTTLLRTTWAALEHARTLAPADAGLIGLAADLLATEGLADRAADELRAALERAPADAGLHRAFIDLYVRAGLEPRLPALYERWSAQGTNATLAWFTGYAWRLAGDVAQRERRFGDALAAYARACDWLGVATTLEPSFRATAEAVRFQAQVSATWCELDSGALDAAAARGLALLRSAPARRGELDGLGRTLAQALAALGQRRVERDDYEHAANEARAIVAELSAARADAAPGEPGELGPLWNNLGFVLREFATQLASGAVPGPDRERRSRAVFGESWQAYRRAAELLSADPRVLNDAALVQVYHLRDNLAEAEAMLTRAVELATAQLAALGATPREEQRFPLAQALGDAHLNLGYLFYHVYRQPARARDEFERALASDSGERSGLREYLAAIDGQREPVPEQDRGAFVAAPRGAPGPPSGNGEIAWEASFAEARARAQAEGRALLVYRRGQALGLAVPARDELVRGADFARRTQACVLVLCDAERLAFVDRRGDGRRVACPRFGTLTCGEHLAAESEFDAWYAERFGAAPGEAAEGFWFAPAAPSGPGELERLDDLASLDALDALAALDAGAAGAAGAGLDSAAFGAVEAGLGGEDGGGEARALVTSPGLAARLALERVLWDGFRSSPARGFVLGALAEGGAHARELLAVCVRQDADPELAAEALAVWPAGLELAPVRRAACWSENEAVRRAAAAVLAREAPSDTAALARAALGGG